jgi:hypothetical protein
MKPLPACSFSHITFTVSQAAITGCNISVNSLDILCDKAYDSVVSRQRKTEHRHKDISWRLPAERGHDGEMPPEQVQVALLMDLRDELKAANGYLKMLAERRSPDEQPRRAHRAKDRGES